MQSNIVYHEKMLSMMLSCICYRKMLSSYARGEASSLRESGYAIKKCYRVMLSKNVIGLCYQFILPIVNPKLLAVVSFA